MSVNTSRTVLYKNDKCCQDSIVSSSAEISSCLKRACQTDYRSSGRTSYSYKSSRDKSKTEKTEFYEPRKISDVKNTGTVIISNAQKSKVGKLAHTQEQCPYRTKCYQCKDLVRRIRSLLDEMKAIKKNETPGAMCDFCKRYSAQGKCRRCEYLQDRFKISENISEDARQQRFKIWLCKVKQFLFTILERETCKHKVYSKSAATDELTNLLHQLKSPLTVREPHIGYFPSIDSLENITESKDILEEVLMRLKSEKRSEDFAVDPDCICKYFADKKLEKAVSEKEISVEEPEQLTTPLPMDTTAEVRIKKDTPKPIKPRIPKERIAKLTKEKEVCKERVPKPLSSPKEEKKPRLSKLEASKKPKDDSEAALLAQMIKQHVMTKEVKQAKSSEKPHVLPIIEDLPSPKIKEARDVDSASGTTIECDTQHLEITEMIKGTQIVPIEPRKELESGSVQPLLFKTTPVCPEPAVVTPSTITPASVALSDKVKKPPFKSKQDVDDKSSPKKGIIRYMLSNREFIDKGWTLLPTTKIMRRMNIYKMVPVNPKLDWFHRHKMKRILHYDSGERLAEIEEDGRGKLYYKSGSLALDYYCAKEENGGLRYVVYSSGENTDAGRKLPVTVLASFDYHGNAVVYDHYGNERLKFNQSEGMLFDDKIGPPGRWKWHTLNDPPVIQPVYADVRVRPNSCLEEYLRHHKEDEKFDPGSKQNREPNLDMLAIELENFLKEKAQALLQEFKPFQIRMKALKLNDQFSLKVLDQANIYLMFREGHTSIKFNLGMLLISNEIIDTDTAEMTQVATPYDHRPPKTESIAEIQIALERARKLGKARGKLRN